MRAIFDRMIVWTTSGRADAWLVAPQLLVRAATDRPLAAVIQKRYARFRRKLTTVIERWQSEGEYAAIFRRIYLPVKSAAMGDGWTMMFPVEPEPFQLRSDKRFGQCSDCNVDTVKYQLK